MALHPARFPGYRPRRPPRGLRLPEGDIALHRLAGREGSRLRWGDDPSAGDGARPRLAPDRASPGSSRAVDEHHGHSPRGGDYAEVLTRAGYDTLGVTSIFFLGRPQGFAQGFRRFQVLDGPPSLDHALIQRLLRRRRLNLALPSSCSFTSTTPTPLQAPPGFRADRAGTREPSAVARAHRRL